jgi:hypothetical protein
MASTRAGVPLRSNELDRATADQSPLRIGDDDLADALELAIAWRGARCGVLLIAG